MQLTVDSQQLPVDWKIKTLDELCEIARGGSPRPIKNGSIPLFKILTDKNNLDR